VTGKLRAYLARMSTTDPDFAAITALERKRKVSVREAAALNSVSEDTFRRNYSHLIKRISKRRQAVELGDAIDLPPAPV
jgi:hypothetical protein